LQVLQISVFSGTNDHKRHRIQRRSAHGASFAAARPAPCLFPATQDRKSLSERSLQMKTTTAENVFKNRQILGNVPSLSAAYKLLSAPVAYEIDCRFVPTESGDFEINCRFVPVYNR
jgi:hypothetical protein